MITGIIKKLLRNETMYQFDETGITDYTKPEHVIHLDWSEVAKVEILTNYSSLQIGILGSRVIEEKKQVSENIRENLMRNGNMVFYNIIIDGFLFRKKTFKEMFKRIEELALCYNQNILISEYVDPLERKKRSV